MPYPGLTFAIIVGMAIGAAVYYYVKNPIASQSYSYSQSANEPYTYTPIETAIRPASQGRRRRNSNSKNCTVCFDNVNNGEPTKVVGCGHIFHDHCIRSWVKLNPTCPVCRNKIGVNNAQ